MKIIPKKRRLERKTNYAKRKKILEHSKARIVIRKSNKYIVVQYVESREAQDSIIVHTSSKELLNYGWPSESSGSLKNLGASYLTGLLFGNKIKEKKELVKEKIVLDSGLIRSTKGSKIYAAVKGIIESGLNLPCGKEMFPEDGRIKNDKIAGFFDKVKENLLKGAKKK